MIQFKLTEAGSRYTGRVTDFVGFLPHCWDPTDPRDAITQHDERQMGNGPWVESFPSKWKFDPETRKLRYPGDPSMEPLAEAHLPLTGETILVYQHAWVAIVQQHDDGSWSVSVDRRD